MTTEEKIKDEIERQHKILMKNHEEYDASFILGFRQACRQIIDYIDKLERGE